MTYKSVIFAALFMAGLVSGITTGQVQTDWLVSVCLLGVVYVCGGTHGLYLGLTHLRRLEVYVGRSIERFEEEAKENV